MKLILVALLAALLSTPAMSATGNVADDFTGFDDTREPPGPEPRLPWRAVPRSEYRYFECTAKDAGWEEHRGGHSGYGPTRYQAQRQALAYCQRLHGRCELDACLRIQ